MDPGDRWAQRGQQPGVARWTGIGGDPMMTTWGDMTLGAWLWMGAWIVALLGMAWLVVRGSHDRPTEQDALDILRARFARGEISGEEYQRARDQLFDPREGGVR